MWSLASVAIWVCARFMELNDSLTSGPWWELPGLISIPCLSPSAAVEPDTWLWDFLLILFPLQELPALFSIPPWVVLASVVLRPLTPWEDPEHFHSCKYYWHLPIIRVCFDFDLSSQLLIHGASCLWTMGSQIDHVLQISMSLQPPPPPVSPSYLRNSPRSQDTAFGIVLDSSLFPAYICSPVWNQNLLIVYSKYQFCLLFHPDHCLVRTLVNFELDGCNGLLLTGLPAYSLASSKSILHSWCLGDLKCKYDLATPLLKTHQHGVVV